MFFGGLPPGFEDAFGGGGMPGGGRRSRKPVDNSKFYEILGVDKNAGPDQIRKAYRKLAVKEHPDKGGDVNKFKDIQKAYDTLSDPARRGARQGAGGGTHRKHVSRLEEGVV